MSARPTIWQIADQIQMDLRAAQAKLVELRAQLAQLDIPDTTKVECPRCGIPLRGQRTLAEHLHHHHDGPVPDHWLAIEALSHDPNDDPEAETAP